jgi:hypothetical protein
MPPCGVSPEGPTGPPPVSCLPELMSSVTVDVQVGSVFATVTSRSTSAVTAPAPSSTLTTRRCGPSSTKVVSSSRSAVPVAGQPCSRSDESGRQPGAPSSPASTALPPSEAWTVRSPLPLRSDAFTVSSR